MFHKRIALLCGLYYFGAALDLDCTKEKKQRKHEQLFDIHYDMQLNVLPLKTIHVTSLTECLFTCTHNCNCLSVNFERRANIHQTHTCELLAEDRITSSKDYKSFIGTDNHVKIYSSLKCGICRPFTLYVESCDCSKRRPVEEHCDIHKKKDLNSPSGLYKIKPIANMSAIFVQCIMGEKGNFVIKGDIVILRRKKGIINFNRSWQEYRDGFGLLPVDFWLGNEIVHQITLKNRHRLDIYMYTAESEEKQFFYDQFTLSNEASGYKLQITGHNFNDSFTAHNEMTFKTHDNDKSGCAREYESGWWFSVHPDDDCLFSNLNGKYTHHECHPKKGMIWDSKTCLWGVVMKIRRI